MEYYSNKDMLLFPEYGRNVQDMIRTIRNEEDAIKRQKLANAIVNLMCQLSPSPKNGPDVKPRVWKHFFAIAEYKIDVVSNEGIKYEAEEAVVKPSKVPYPPTNETYRHYGNHVRKLILRAAEMEDGPKKNYFVSLIGSYMKMAYKTWNKEHYVTDEGILRDLAILSKGKLQTGEETSLDVLSKRGKGGNLQPASSESKPYRHNKFKNRGNNKNRFGNNNNRNHRRR